MAEKMLFNDSLRKTKYKSSNQDFDYKKKLLKEKKIDQEFLNKLKFLTIEEILYLKLDSAFLSLKGKLMGFPIFKLLPEICKESLLLFALSNTKNKREASTIMGINKHKLNYLIKKYNIKL